MFGLPQIVVAPILSSLGSGSATWPTVGAVMVWFLVAAFVGSALGILHEGSWTNFNLDQSNNRTVLPLRRPPTLQHNGHREAA